MPDITKEASSESAELHGVFEAAAVIPAGRPMLAISHGIIRKVACPTDHGRWVVSGRPDPIHLPPHRIP